MAKFRPGVTFTDFVISDTASKKSRIPGENSVKVTLGVWLWVMILAGMLLLIVRLGSLQVLQGSRYRVLAEENRIKRIVIPAERGTVFDRQGLVLARDVIEEKQLSGFTEYEVRREYPFGPSAAHAVGYLGEVGEDEVGLLKSNGGKYDLKDRIGRAGIESEYESILRGINGGLLVEVASDGTADRTLGRQESVPGQDITLTLDANLQQVALEALGGKKGAVVASNPHTGEIFALVSSPSFNPHDLSLAVVDPNLPLVNRAIGGIYAPGSTFKMVSALAALEEHKVPTSFTFEDTGSIQAGGTTFTNWYFTSYGRTEGLVGFARALARSTDTFFYKIGELTGPEVMGEWAKIFGLGVESEIDIPGEVVGLIPDPEWKRKNKGEPWYLGNSFHMAIGQGDLLVTPLQVNIMTGILATGGQKCRPKIGQAKTECETVEAQAEYLEIIKEGMVGACSVGGTAFPLFDFTPQVACKTGTSEYLKSDGKIGTHAWLTAYAPADDPQIAVTALLEAGGEGSRDAAPVVRKVLSKFFGVTDTYNYRATSGIGE